MSAAVVTWSLMSGEGLELDVCGVAGVGRSPEGRAVQGALDAWYR